MTKAHETGWFDEKSGTYDNPPPDQQKEVPYHRRQVLTESANIQRDGGHIYLQLTRTPEALIVKMSLKDAADLVEALQIALVPVD